MPFKDKEKLKEYKKLWIAKKRKGEKENVEPYLETKPNVEPYPLVEPKKNNFVEPKHVEPKYKNVEPSKSVEPEIPSNQISYNQALEALKAQWETQEKGKCYGYRPEPITKLHYCNACDYHAYRNETKPWLKVQKPQPQQNQPISKLWAYYYNCKKPFCLGCQQLGIKENEYRFCSKMKINPNEFQCQVFHWTIFQSFNN